MELGHIRKTHFRNNWSYGTFYQSITGQRVYVTLVEILLLSFLFFNFFFSTNVLYCSPRKRSNRSRLYYLVSKGKTILKKTKGSLLLTGKRRTCLMNNLHRLCFRNVAEYKSCNTSITNKVIEWRDYFSREHKLFLVCRNSQHFLNIVTENHFKPKISSEIQRTRSGC